MENVQRPIPQLVAVPKIFEVVDAVAEVVQATRHQVLSDIETPYMADARRVAIAIAAVRLKIDLDALAMHFGVPKEVAKKATAKALPIFVNHAIPMAAPLRAVAALLYEHMVGKQKPATGVKIDEIKRAVCNEFGVSRSELEADRRLRAIVIPRQIGMTLAKHLTPRSLVYIGAQFGGRDHSTVLHACKVMAKPLAVAVSLLSPDASIETWAAAVRAAREGDAATLARFAPVEAVTQ